MFYEMMRSPLGDFRNLVTQFSRQIALELVTPGVLWPARLAGDVGCQQPHHLIGTRRAND
jgi:hypothetical protein